MKHGFTILSPIIIFLLIFTTIPLSSKAASLSPTASPEPSASPEPTPFVAQEHPEDVLEPEMIAAPSAVLMDAKTGVIIFEKNMHERNFPASITKLMTALLTLENLTDMDERLEFSHEAVFSIEPGSSSIAMDEGETLTVEEALHGLMLASANEVSNALAEKISGDVDSFAELMNSRAKRLGAENTNFVNPHGLHDENHYTTAYDMALIMKECIQHPDFQRIISTTSYFIPPTERQPEERPLSNSCKMIHSNNPNYNPDVVGGKTGFTSQAQQTLVTFGRRGDIELIAVVLNDIATRTYADTSELLNYGFTQFEELQIFDKSDFKKSVMIGDNEVQAAAAENLFAFLPKTALGNITQKNNLPDRLSESVKEGEILGTLKVYYDDIELGGTDLVALGSVEYVPTIATQQEPSEKSGEGFDIDKLLTAFLWIAGMVLSLVIFLWILALVARRHGGGRRRYKYGVTQSKSPNYRYRYKK